MPVVVNVKGSGCRFLALDACFEHVSKGGRARGSRRPFGAEEDEGSDVCAVTMLDGHVDRLPASDVSVTRMDDVLLGDLLHG